MMRETGVITRVEEIGADAIAIPLLSVTPKSLLIACQTVHGPLNVRISEDAALQLAETLNTHFCGRSYRIVSS
jgi:hypothetical protein